MKGKDLINWKETDLYKFTQEHREANVESWGGYVGKNDGYEPMGYEVSYDGKCYFFGLDGHYIKSKAL